MKFEDDPIKITQKIRVSSTPLICDQVTLTFKILCAEGYLYRTMICEITRVSNDNSVLQSDLNGKNPMITHKQTNKKKTYKVTNISCKNFVLAR